MRVFIFGCLESRMDKRRLISMRFTGHRRVETRMNKRFAILKSAFFSGKMVGEIAGAEVPANPRICSENSGEASSSPESEHGAVKFVLFFYVLSNFFLKQENRDG